MASKKDEINEILQTFSNGALKDEELQKLMTEFYETEVVTGIQDPIILGRIFDYLDNKLQTEIRATLKS